MNRDPLFAEHLRTKDAEFLREFVKAIVFAFQAIVDSVPLMAMHLSSPGPKGPTAHG